LADTLIALLQRTSDAQVIGQRGRAVFEAEAGATVRTAQALVSLLEQRAGTAR
jgi:3-deoxy-D-manno-octulosonic-acid transferase